MRFNAHLLEIDLKSCCFKTGKHANVYFLFFGKGTNGLGLFKKKKKQDLVKLYYLHLSIIYKKWATKELRKYEPRMILTLKYYSAK